MTRVELNIRRLVVHGRGRFDGEAFSGALKQEIGHYLREGGSVVTEGPRQEALTAGRSEHIQSPATYAASSVARRLFK